MCRGAALACAWLVIGCAAGPPQQEREDHRLLQTDRLARIAFEQQRAEQAAALYRQALDQAYARDDLRAIGDVGYDLAVAELESGRPVVARDVSRGISAELRRRGAAIPPALELVEAAALYRSGDVEAAARHAGEIAADAKAPADVRARATFFEGLAAADRGDEAILAATILVLADASSEPLLADRDELLGRLALQRGDADAAEAALRSAARRRQQQLDYRGMARALAIAGTAAAAAGRGPEAADLLLRAGRSAQLLGEGENARRWLTAAAEQGRIADAAEVVAEAELRLAMLPGADSARPARGSASGEHLR